MPETLTDPAHTARFPLRRHVAGRPMTRKEWLGALLGRQQDREQLEVDLDACIASKSDCRICADHCPAGALVVEKGRVSLTPDLCEDCGACIRWCPQGAISLTSFSTRKIIEKISKIAVGKDKSDDYPAAGVILTCKKCADPLSEFTKQETTAQGFRFLQIPCIGALSPLVFLEGLRSGIGTVICACTEPDCPNRKSAEDCGRLMATLNRLTAFVRNRRRMPPFLMLDKEGMNHLLHTQESFIEGIIPRPSLPASPMEKASHRAALLSLVETLLKAPYPVKRMGGLPLPFFDLQIDPAKCTLCGACKRNCPTGALTLTSENTCKLLFSTRACIGCGTCVGRCPEGAVRLETVFLPDAVINGTACMKTEAEVIRCKDCGKSISNISLLNKIESDMRSRGFDSAIANVYLCETCKRTRALFS